MHPPTCRSTTNHRHRLAQGRTALAIAVYFLDARPKRSLGIIGALLAAGADPLCQDFHGIGSLLLRWVGAAGGWGWLLACGCWWGWF